MEQSAPLYEILFQETLPVQDQYVKCVDAHLGFQVFSLHMFATPLSQKLERQDFVANFIVRNKLSVEYKVVHRQRDIFLQELNNIRVGYGHVFQIPGVNRDGIGTPDEMNLASEAVVLVLAGKVDAIKSFQNNCDSFGRLGEHWFKRDTNDHVALFS